jgi:hypothetical protein
MNRIYPKPKKKTYRSYDAPWIAAINKRTHSVSIMAEKQLRAKITQAACCTAASVRYYYVQATPYESRSGKYFPAVCGV